MQIITGVVLAMFYDANSELAFRSIIYINNEVYYGWWFRYMHSNGASFFFIVVYLHICRGIYYGSYLYPRQILWISGVFIWILMIATAFLGYILPWGQMSFWGAMVITSLLGAIPLLGFDILLLLWGGYSIDNSTLHRFYSLHYLLPFIILMLSIIHILFLHEFGSNNVLGISSQLDNIPFNPYFTLKDFFSLVILFFFFFYIIFVLPDLLGHSDNYILANFLSTPSHIVPEWYFLPLYAVLRSVTDKLLGILMIAWFILSLFFLPFLLKNSIIRSSSFRPIHVFFVSFFLMTCLLIGWIGGLPVMGLYVQIGQFLTFLYFFILYVFLPFSNMFESLIFNLYIIRVYFYD